MITTRSRRYNQPNTIDLTFKGNPMSNIMRSTERPYMWLTICVACKLWSEHAPLRRYSPLKTQLPWFDQCQMSSGKLRDHTWLTICVYVNFGYNMHRFSDILVQIDHKCPNLTFLTFKMTFRVTLHHLYFMTALQWIYMMQDKWAALRNYWII